MPQPLCAESGDAGQASELDELQRVRQRIIESIIGDESGGPAWQAALDRDDARRAELLDSPFEPLVWEDQNDDPEDDRPSGRIRARAGEMRLLAEGYANPASEHFESERVVARVIESLEDLLAYFNPTTPRPGNWYSWIMTIPGQLGSMGLLIGEEIPQPLMDRMLSSIRQEIGGLHLTGANAAAEARNHLYLALLEQNPDRLQRTATHAFQTLVYTTRSGLLEDYSYVFHGRIPYAGTYGMGFANNTAEFLQLFDGTRWTALPEQRELLANFLLEHARWFIVGAVYDMHITGRHYARRHSANRMLNAMLLMTQVDTSRRAELEAAAASLINRGLPVPADLAVIASRIDPSAAEEPRGFRYWYNAEMGAYKGDGFHVGLRQLSQRTQDYELLTGRGGEGWNLAYGFTNVGRDGEQWYCPDAEDRDERHRFRVDLCDGIDMVHLPGTTARIGAEPANPDHSIHVTGHSLNHGTSPFAGGAGWREGGVAGFILEPTQGDFTARKSVHFFPAGFWALGSGIRAEPGGDFAGLPIRTTALQWPTDDPVTISGDREFAGADAEQTFEDVRWLYVDGVGCVFAEPTTVTLRRHHAVVTAWIDHGADAQDEAYAYAMLPVATLEQTRQFAEDRPVRPVGLDRSVHAVRDASRAADSFVFFESGTHDGLAVDHPAIIYRLRGSDGGVLAIQNPLHTTQTLELVGQLDGPLTLPDREVSVQDHGDGRRTISVDSAHGRIYRLGFGERGRAAASVPRQDLAEFYAFRVDAEHTSGQSVFTMHLPNEVLETGYDLSLRGRQGHLLKPLTEADVLDRPAENVVRYVWTHGDTVAGTGGYLQQRSGRFAISLKADAKEAEVWVNIPESPDE
ncbi:MAG: polysaccharide lyase family 8 super-sandwich domain-containing protein [Phycisphaeraceae bacterium]